MNRATEMELTAFRGDLTGVLERLDETGPLKLTKYNDTVAEIRSASPEGDRRYAATVLDALGYFEKLSGGLAFHLADIGIDTLAALGELARRHKQFADDGATFDAYPEHTLPEAGPLTVDEALARLYFGDDYPKSSAEPYAWFLACVQIQRKAKRFGMPVALPQPNAYDEESPTFVELAVASGHTPQSLVEFAAQALAQGVRLERLADMFGSEPIPADVLALDHYNDYDFAQLTKTGLPHAEAVAVFRKNLDTRVAGDLAGAGIRSADEIERLVDSKLNIGLAVRAAGDGLAPEEWKAQVPQIQHLKYPGASYRYGSEAAGLLPFRLLVQAAEEKLSLVRWDTSSLRVRADETNKYFDASPAQRQTMYPWSFIYPDRVLDVARAKTSPSFITAFSRLMRHHFDGAAASEDFVDVAIQACELGLTTEMANAMSRSDGKQPEFTPLQLLAALREGLDFGAAHYLADRHKDPALWIEDLREQRARQLMTDTFVATVAGTPAWEAVTAAVSSMKHLMKTRAFRGDVHLKWVVEKFLADKPLNSREVAVLLNHTAHAFGNRSTLTRTWLEEYGDSAGAVRDLARNYQRMCETPAA